MDLSAAFSNLTQSYNDYHPIEGPAKRTLVSDAPSGPTRNNHRGTKNTANRRNPTPSFAQSSSSSSKVVIAAVTPRASAPTAQRLSGTSLGASAPLLLPCTPFSPSSKNGVTAIGTTIFHCHECPTTCDDVRSPLSQSREGLCPRHDECATQADVAQSSLRSVVNAEELCQEAENASRSDDGKFYHGSSSNKCDDGTRAASTGMSDQYGTDFPELPDYLAHNGELISLLQAWYWSGYYTGLHAQSQ
eukprot:GEMP01066972.1.p1 GENE.GEMP01066972.1~~GEMP01066972.1.p1  ORF type:complete len:246 (+),score=42.75 GEMP01066972.1:37-774(+)